MQNLLQGAVVQKFILRISKVRYSKEKEPSKKVSPVVWFAQASRYTSPYLVLRLIVHETGVHVLVLQILFDARDVGAVPTDGSPCERFFFVAARRMR
jgi:hypothetical protein